MNNDHPLHTPDTNHPPVLELARQIQLFAFDVDGTLTDGRIYLNGDGEDTLAFHGHDGYGIKAIMRAGLPVAAISGRLSFAAKRRLLSLGVKHLYLGCDDKVAALQELSDQLQIPLQNMAYIGDDYIDLPALQQVGLACAVNDAHPHLLRHVLIHCRKPGGYGAVREIVELILRARGELDQLLPPMQATPDTR